MNTEEAAASETNTNTAEAPASETDTTPAEAPASGTDVNNVAAAASEVDRNTAEAATAPAASAAETAHETPVSDAGQPQAAPAATPPESAAAAEPEAPPYVLVNVMERLVDDKLDDYIKKFDVCTCPRCRVDVKALALSRMEAKYVVLDKSGVSAFLSLYTNKFASEVMFHLGKACMQVLTSPRH